MCELENGLIEYKGPRKMARKALLLAGMQPERVDMYSYPVELDQRQLDFIRNSDPIHYQRLQGEVQVYFPLHGNRINVDGDIRVYTTRLIYKFCSDGQNDDQRAELAAIPDRIKERIEKLMAVE